MSAPNSSPIGLGGRQVSPELAQALAHLSPLFEGLVAYFIYKTTTPEARAEQARLEAERAPQLRAMESHIRNNMREAFFRTVEQKLNESPPDYAWIVRLYGEIRERLCNLTPGRRDLRAQVEEAMDLALFQQMLENNAYDGDQLANLVSFVFGRISELEAPARNASTNAAVAELRAEMVKPETTFAMLVPMFLKAVHTKLDELEGDIANIRAQMQQARQAAQTQANR